MTVKELKEKTIKIGKNKFLIINVELGGQKFRVKFENSEVTKNKFLGRAIKMAWVHIFTEKTLHVIDKARIGDSDSLVITSTDFDSENDVIF